MNIKQLLRSKTKDQVSIIILTEPEQLDQIADQWHDLFLNNPLTTPFQSPKWSMNWWKYFGKGKLWVPTIWNSGKLITIAPFQITSNNGLRKMAFIGDAVTDYFDIITSSDFPAPVREIYELIKDSQSKWDICQFDNLRQDSPLLNSNPVNGINLRVNKIELCPVVELPDNFDDYFKALTSDRRVKIRRAKKRLEQAGTIEFQKARKNNVPEFMNELFDLHKKRWQQKDMPGVLDLPEVRRFHMEMAEYFAKEKLLYLYRLTFNGQTIAVHYAFGKVPNIYNYLGGFDPDFYKFSPASVLMLHVLEQAVKNEFRHFDLLRGSEEYKYKWLSQDQPLYRMTIWH